MPTFEPVAGTPKFPLFPPQSNPQVARQLLDQMLGGRVAAPPEMIHGPLLRELRSQGIFPGGQVPGASMPPMVRSEELFQRAIPAAGETGMGVAPLLSPTAPPGPYHGPSQMAYPPVTDVKYPIRGAAKIRLPAETRMSPLADAMPALPPGQYGPPNPVTGRIGDTQVFQPYEPNFDMTGQSTAQSAGRPPGKSLAVIDEVTKPMGELMPGSGRAYDVGPVEFGPPKPSVGGAGAAATAEYGAPVNLMHGPVNPETGLIGGMEGAATKGGKGLLDKLLWRGVVPEGATGLGKAKAIGGELLGRSMYALPISMVGQALENRYDQYNTHDNPVVNALAGASRGGAAGAMIGGPWGALIGAGIGGGANLLTGGGAEDVFDSVPIVGDFFGGGGAARENRTKIEEAQGAGMLNAGEGLKELNARQAKYTMAQNMGLAPEVAAEYAFGDTDGYKRMKAINEAFSNPTGVTDADVVRAMGEYMQVPMENLINSSNAQIAELQAAAPGYAGSIAAAAPMMQQATNAQAAAMMQQALLAPFNIRNAKAEKAYANAQGFNQGYSQGTKLTKNEGGSGSDSFSQLLASVQGQG